MKGWEVSSMRICLYVCQSVRPSVRCSVSLSVCVFVFLSVYYGDDGLSIRTWIHLILCCLQEISTTSTLVVICPRIMYTVNILRLSLFVIFKKRIRALNTYMSLKDYDYHM